AAARGLIEGRVEEAREAGAPGRGRVRGMAQAVPADDRAVALLVTRHQDRRHTARFGTGTGAVIGRGAWVELQKPLIRAPAVVLPRGLPALGEVDLLPIVLPDAGDDEVSRQPVEREAIRIAKPVGPDLRPRARAPHTWVVSRHVVAAARPGLDPEELPQP